MLVKIRKARKQEYPLLRKMCDEHLTDEEDGSVWEEASICWVATYEKQVIGFASFVDSKRYSDVVRFCAAVVLPAFRGHGIQRRLIRARLNYARRKGYNYAITDTVTYNPISARNLISCGFLPYWPTYRWKGDLACYWTCSLHPKLKSKIRI